MNNNLQKEIIKHIFSCVGIIEDKRKFLINFMSDEFLINKKIAFEDENGKKHENSVWAAETLVDKSPVQIMIADLTEDVKEYALIVKFDSSHPYGLKLSSDENDIGIISFNFQNNNWVPCDILVQGKFLVGMEHLSGLFLNWKKISNYDSMYKVLIGFLNSV